MKTAEKTKKFKIKFTILVVIFIVVFFGSFMLGRYPVSPPELMKIILSGIIDIPQSWPDAAENVIFQIRLPRVLAAAIIGAALSIAGVSYQGMFQNPMVSPDILGASSGAGFGAALAILLGAGYMGISVAAFLFGLAAVMLAYGISRVSRINATLAMILAGMMIGSLFTSCTSFVKLVADTEQTLPAITYWLMGSFTSAKYEKIMIGSPFIIVGIVIIYLLRWRLNILALSEDEAKASGIDIKKTRMVFILASTLITASAVSMCGQVGWIGLLIPHCARMLVGSNNRYVVPVSISLGASFMIIIDTLSRTISVIELPLSVLTAIIGAPVYKSLLNRNRSNLQ